MDNELEPKAVSSPAESADYVYQDSKLKVKGNRIIRARLIGRAGINQYKRLFPEALQRETLPSINKQKVNIDHLNLNTDKFRGFKDRLGWVENARIIAGETYGDLVINPKHPWAETLLWWAEHKPDMVGISMDFYHDWVDTPEGRLVTKIHKIEGFDIVADPSNTRGLEAVEVPKKKKGRKVPPKPKPRKKGTNQDPVDPTPPGKNPPQPPIDSTAASVSSGDNPQANDPNGDGTQEYAPDDLPNFDPMNYVGDDYTLKLGELVESIICDDSLSVDEKRKKVMISLQLLTEEPAGEDTEEEDESEEDESEEETENEDPEMANVQGLEAVTKERDTFKAEVEALSVKLRAFEAKEAKEAAIKTAAVLCTTRGLESQYQDDYLLELLAGKSVEEQHRIIDREKAKVTARAQEAVQKGVPAVTSTERQPLVAPVKKELPSVSDLIKEARL